METDMPKCRLRGKVYIDNKEPRYLLWWASHCIPFVYQMKHTLHLDIKHLLCKSKNFQNFIENGIDTRTYFGAKKVEIHICIDFESIEDPSLCSAITEPAHPSPPYTLASLFLLSLLQSLNKYLNVLSWPGMGLLWKPRDVVPGYVNLGLCEREGY